MVTVMGTVALDVVATVVRHPGVDEATRVTGLGRSFGGTAGNVAMGLGRLGVPTRLVAAVGGAFTSSGYEDALTAAGVDLADVVRASGNDAEAFTFTDDGGQQRIYFHAGVSEDLEAARVEAATLAHFAAGAFCHYAPHMEAAEVACLDPGQELFHRPFDQLEPLLPLADVLFVNRPERRHLEGFGWPVDRLLDVGPRLVVETRGAEAQVLHAADGQTKVDVAPAKVADPTGGGDAHRAGFLLGLAEGVDDEEAARLGAVAAAFVVEEVGTQWGLPTREVIEERYAATYGSSPL